MTECSHCEKEMPAGLTLCNSGADDLRRILDRVRDTLNTAGGTLTNTAVAPQADGGGGVGAEAPGLPYSEDMSIYVRDYQEKIRYWARLIGEGQALTLPAGTSITVPLDTVHAAAFVRDRMGLIRGNEYANTILQELRKAERQVINAADRNAPKLLLGTCNSPIWEDEAIVFCTGQVIGREGDDQAKCDTCRATHSATDRTNTKLAQAWHIIAPLPQVLRALKEYGTTIRYDTAKKWVRRGKLAPVCDLRTRTEGYSPAAVLNAMPKTPTSTKQPTYSK